MSDPTRPATPDLDALAAEVLELDAKATPGPWVATDNAYSDVGIERFGGISGPEFFDDDGNDHNDVAEELCHSGNRDFIAHARTGYPLLAREVQRLRRVEKAARVLARHVQSVHQMPHYDSMAGSVGCPICAALATVEKETKP